MLFLRSLAFAIGQVASILIVAPLAVLIAPLPFPSRYRVISSWARFNLWWLELTCGLGYHVGGREHIPARTAIIMSKHQSAWETMALQLIFPMQVWVLKRELLWIPFFGWGLATMEPIAIDRKAGRQAIQQIVDQGQKRLDNGRWVVVFPEGTRVAPGQRRRYGIGGGVLAQKTGYPVVPVAHNAGEFWPRRSFLKRPGTIRVEIGPPIETVGLSAAEITRRVEDWIETTAASLGTMGNNPRPRQ